MEEQEELRQQSEYGRKAKIAQEVTKDFITQQRVQIINALETAAWEQETFLNYVRSLRLLRMFEQMIERYIDEGNIADEELSKNGQSRI